MASSIDYVPVDIDMLDDPKVSALLNDLSDGDPAARFAAYGRFVLVLQRIYHDGFYMRYGKFERRKLAKDAGMAPEELDAFLEACAECEVLDAGMLERGALTSRGIQRRYFRARKAALSSVSEEDAPFVIARAEDCREPPRTSEKRREVPIIAEKRRTLKEKRREVKRSEEEEGARGRGVRSLLLFIAPQPSGRSLRQSPALVPGRGRGPVVALLRRRRERVRHAVGRPRGGLRGADARAAHRPIRRADGGALPRRLPARPRARRGLRSSAAQGGRAVRPGQGIALPPGAQDHRGREG